MNDFSELLPHWFSEHRAQVASNRCYLRLFEQTELSDKEAERLLWSSCHAMGRQ